MVSHAGGSVSSSLPIIEVKDVGPLVSLPMSSLIPGDALRLSPAGPPPGWNPPGPMPIGVGPPCGPWADELVVVLPPHPQLATRKATTATDINATRGDLVIAIIPRTRPCDNPIPS